MFLTNEMEAALSEGIPLTAANATLLYLTLRYLRVTIRVIGRFSNGQILLGADKQLQADDLLLIKNVVEIIDDILIDWRHDPLAKEHSAILERLSFKRQDLELALTAL